MKNKSNAKWIATIIIMAFTISLVFSFTSELLLKDAGLILGIVLVLIFILLGMVFDMIGVAVTSADEKPIISMNAKKVKGSNTAVKLIKNSDKVASLCNDVVGDICGIVSGTAGVAVAASISLKFDIDLFIVSLLVTSIIAALTIGSKAMGKGFAIKNSTKIITIFSKILSIFEFKKKNK